MSLNFIIPHVPDNNHELEPLVMAPETSEKEANMLDEKQVMNK